MIQDSINRISYDGNGIATEFAYPFTIITSSDIKVMIVDTDGTETVLTNDYYVDEVNSKVDYPGYPEGEEPLPENQPPILATGQKIVIYRELSVTQLTSLFDQYPFKTIEAMIDKTTILLQQLKDAQERALTLSVATSTDVSLVLPAPSALKSFRWNSSANKLELTADPATVLESVQGYTEQAEGYATSSAEFASASSASATSASGYASDALQSVSDAQDIIDTLDFASEAEATAGTLETKVMSPSTTKASILANAPVTPIATAITAGKVIVGDNIDVTEEGKISVTFPTPQTISVTTGTVSGNSGTIPLPSGYTREQCYYMVSMNYFNETTNVGDTSFACSVVASTGVVTCYTSYENASANHYRTANYICVAIK